MAILGGSGISVTDVSDALVTTDGLPPRGASNGTLWLDGKTLKKYENGNWVIQEIDVTKLDPDLAEKIEGIMDNLGTIGDDSKLTFNDRSILARELGEIIGVIPSKSTGNVYPSSLPAYNVLDSSGSGTFSNVRARAVTVGMDVNDSRYKAVETAYTSLNSYLSQYNPKAWDITTANKDKIVTLTDPDMFRQKFLDYYTAELKLATEVERVAKESAEDYVDELTDGVSLKDKTDILSGNPIYTDKADDNSVVHVEVDGKSVGGGSGKNLIRRFTEVTVVSPSTGAWVFDTLRFDTLTAGKRYVFSANVEVLAGTLTNGSNISVLARKSNGDASTGFVGTTIQNGRIVGTMLALEDTNQIYLYAGTAGYTNGNTVRFTNIQLEQNDVVEATPFEERVPEPDYPIAINSLNNVDVVSSVGERNLVKKSETWTINSNNGTVYPITTELIKEDGIEFTRIKPHATIGSGILSTYDTLRGLDITDKNWRGKNVTFSLRIRNSFIGRTTGIYPYVQKNGVTHYGQATNIINTGEWQVISYTFKNFPYDISDTDYIRFMPTASYDMRGHQLDLRGYQISFEDTVYRIWNPAPEDIQPDTPNPTIYKTNISLPEPLRSVGNVKDRLFIDTDGLWKVERNVGVTIINGSENWVYRQPTDGGLYLYNLDGFANGSYKPYAETMSSHYKYNEITALATGVAQTEEGYGLYPKQNGVNQYLYLVSKKTTIAELKEQFSGSPVTFLYELETPTVETLPDDLQQKLNNIQSYKGSNYVYTVLPNKSDILTPNLRATFKSKGWYREFSNEAWKVESEKALENLDKEIGDVDKVAQALKNFTDTAFADGIIQMAEAQAISEHLNTLKKENDDLSNQYTTIYGNTNLIGTPKTNLASAKTAYNTAYTNLNNSINTAISGNKTTPAQKTDVDNKFTSYSNALKLLNQRLNEALSAIADKIATDVATAKANLAKTEASAYADGIVTAEEKRAIADAKAKLAEAQRYADSAVGNVAVGVGNLLMNSRINVTTSSYLMHTIALTETIKDGTEVTILLKGQLGVGKQYFGIYNSGGTVMLQGLTPTMQDANGIYKATFNWRLSGANNALHIYAIANTVTVNSTIEWVKLVYGNKTSPTWEPSIADQEKDLHDATRLPVRYIRDWSAGSDMNTSSHWVEIQAIQNGVNVAKGKTVTSSSVVSSPTVIVDGNTASGSFASMSNTVETVPDPSTGGTKTVVTPGHVIVDLGKVYNDLESIKVWHYYADERTYNNTLTEVSVDGENWTALYDSDIMGVYPETSQGRTYSVITNQLASNAIQHTTNLVSRVNNVEQQITADSIVSTVMAQEKFTSWQEIVDAKPTPEAFDILSGNLSSTTDAVATIETRVTEVEQTATSWGVTLNEQQEIINGHGTTVSDIKTYMTFKDTGLEIGKSDSNMKVNISNTQIDFMDNGVSVAWINGQQLYIRNAQILDTLVIGNHKFEKLGTDMTVISWNG